VTCNEFVTKERRVHHKGTKDSKTDFLTEENEGKHPKGPEKRFPSYRATPTITFASLLTFASLRLCVRFFLLGCSFVNVAAWKETRPALCSSRSLGDRGHRSPMGMANPGPLIQSQDY
jgi:hypothetical protein